MKVTLSNPLVVDITDDEVAAYGDDDDNQYVYTSSGGENLFLTIGGLRIRMTEEQEEKIRYYFQNT